MRIIVPGRAAAAAPALALAFALTLAACGGDATGPTGREDSPGDVDLSVMARGADLPGLASDLGRMASDDCSYDAALGRFTCPPVTREGLTIVRSYAFYDAAGNPQQAYDEQTTAAVNRQVSVSGRTTRRDAVSLVNRQASVTVSGLEGSETTRIWNGTESATTETRIRRNDRTGRVVSTVGGSTVNVVTPVGDAGEAWPLSGTATQSGQRTVLRPDQDPEHHTFQRVVSFNGTRLAQVTLTRDGETRSCTLDLETRKLDCGE